MARETYFTRLSREDPEAMKALTRRGGLTMVARHGADSNASKARAAKKAKRIALIDPDGTLSPEELTIRLGYLARAEALKLVEARRLKRAARLAATSA